MKHKITLITLLFVSTIGFAQAYTWTGNAGSGLWNNSNNWTYNGSPTLPLNNGFDNLVFDNNSELIMTNDFPVSNYEIVYFTANATSARNIGGNLVNTIGDGGIRNRSSATHTINFPIQFPGSSYIINDSGGTGDLIFGGTIEMAEFTNLSILPDNAATYTFNNVISGNGNVVISFSSSPGTVIFKTDNTYTGTTTIAGSDLVLQADLPNSEIRPVFSGILTIDGANINIASLNGGSPSSLVAINNGSSLTSGTFYNPGDITLSPNSSLTVNGDLTQINTSGVMTLNTNTTVTVNGNFIVRSNLEIPNGATVNVTGNLENGGGVITIQPGGKLTVGGTHIRNNLLDMIINSDATGSGSYIRSGSGTAEITYNQHLTGSGNWHLMSSPLVGNPLESLTQAISGFINTYGASMAQDGLKYSLATYDNTGVIDVSTWKHFTTDANNPSQASAFVTGKGYEILMTNTQTVAFRGTVPSTQVDIAITEGLSRWNLIGNPYPSSIFGNFSAEATNNFLTINTAQLDPSFVSMYFWNPTNGSYDIINQATGSRSIPPGQAFFVKSKSGGGTASFTPAMRTHQTANKFQKGNTSTIPTVTLTADNKSGTVSSTNIKYMSGTTLGLDPGYDAGQFGGTGKGNFNLFTELAKDTGNGVNFTLQVVPDTNYESTVIPVGLEANSGTQISFKATATGLPTGKKVFLEDKLLNSFKEINNTDKSYTVTLNSNLSGTGRFYLHTRSSTLDIDDYSVVESQYTLVPSPEQNNIRLYGAVTEKGSVNIFDTFGRQIHNTTLQKGTEQDIKVPVLSTGVYILKFNIDNKPFSKKIMWY